MAHGPNGPDVWSTISQANDRSEEYLTIFETHGSVRITAFTLENHPMIDLKLAENLPNNHFALLQYFGFD
jgi:hypothetical protein